MLDQIMPALVIPKYSRIHLAFEKLSGTFEQTSNRKTINVCGAVHEKFTIMTKMRVFFQNDATHGSPPLGGWMVIK